MKCKLYVVMPSYNKEQYITQAIDSVLAQQTNFNVTLIITDDGSTDKTLEIVNDYIKKYPNKIVLLPSEKNQGLLSNIIKAYEYLIKNKSEYFCCLDADDFLTDDKFYQNAIDFLDKNKDFNIYAAKTSVLFPDGKTVVSRPADGITFVDSTFMDMLNGTAVLGNTISSVFRNCVLNKELIEKMKQYVGDHYSEHSFRKEAFRILQHTFLFILRHEKGLYRRKPKRRSSPPVCAWKWPRLRLTTASTAFSRIRTLTRLTPSVTISASGESPTFSVPMKFLVCRYRTSMRSPFVSVPPSTRPWPPLATSSTSTTRT